LRDTVAARRESPLSAERNAVLLAHLLVEVVHIEN
jgi:hypothetical protein